MGERTPARITGRLFGAAPAFLLGLLLPVVVTVVTIVLRHTFDRPFIFLYLPPLLVVAYLGGLLPAAVGAVLSTVLADFFFVDPAGLSVTELKADALPSLIFLASGLVIAAAGNQYRLYRLRLRGDLQRSGRRREIDALLIDVGDLLAKREETKRVYGDVCGRFAEALGGWCTIAAPSPGDERIAVLGSSAGADRLGPADDLVSSLTSGDGPLAAWIAGQAEAAVVWRGGRGADLREQGMKQWLSRHSLEGALAAPLRLGADSSGYLAIMTTSSHPGWDADVRRGVTMLAERIALAMQRDRLAAEGARREREQAFLDGLMVEFAAERDMTSTLETVAQRCADHLGDWCGISLLDADGRTLTLTAAHHRDPAKVERIRGIVAQTTPASVDHPMTARVLAGRVPVEVDAADSRVLSGAIHYRKTPLGTLSIGVDTARRWDARDLRLFAEVADRTGVAIQNFRLRDAERAARAQAERDSARVSAVSRVIAIAAATIDLGAVYDEFAETLQTLLPFTRVTVSLYDADRQWLTMPYFKGPELTAPPQRLEGPKEGTVRGWVIDTDRPFVRDDALEAHEFEEDGLLGAAGIRSYLVIPMRAGGRPVATLNFGHTRPHFYTEEHARLIQPIADQLALTVEHARLYEQQRRLAADLSDTVHRALLPKDLPEVPFAALAAFYRPADPEGKVGGDWYDAVLLPDDRLLLSIGDVAGHGLAAASEMGQARHIIRAYALEGRQPAQILTALNQVFWRLPETPHLSVWVGTVDPFTGRLDHSSAGTPPPYLLAGREITPLDAGGPPLGSSPGFAYAEEQAALGPGMRLLLYTDGLIEVTRDVVEGERRLREALAATAGAPGPAAGEILLREVLRGVEPQDDVALLIFDLLAEDAPLTLAVEAIPVNLHRVRRAVRALAARHGVAAGKAEEIVLAVGEATLNAVEHAYRGRPGRVTVRGARAGEVLTVSVRDYGQWQAPRDAGRGRGTGMMRGFSDEFKLYTSPAGTLVEMSWRLAERPATSS
ncbi:MAG: SpoIIE family protein phosphatase [bacterium]